MKDKARDADSTAAEHVNGIGGGAGKAQDPVQLMGPDSPVPAVPDLDSAKYASEDDLVKDIVAGMRLAGGCVVRHLVRQETLDEIEREVRPHLDAAEPWNGQYGRSF
jgi:hypothetical protein